MSTKKKEQRILQLAKKNKINPPGGGETIGGRIKKNNPPPEALPHEPFEAQTPLRKRDRADEIEVDYEAEEAEEKVDDDSLRDIMAGEDQNSTQNKKSSSPKTKKSKWTTTQVVIQTNAPTFGARIEKFDHASVKRLGEWIRTSAMANNPVNLIDVVSEHCIFFVNSLIAASDHDEE